MRIAIGLLAASGVTLMVQGLPIFRKPRLSRRVEPYLSGLHGRPSGLLIQVHHSFEGLLRGQAGRALTRLLPATSDHLASRIAWAGLSISAGAFRLVQLTWGLVGVLGTWITAGIGVRAGVGIDARAVPLLTALGFMSGFLARDWWLGRQIESRRAALQEELPTAIDLVTLSIIAGESVPAAFDRVAKHMPGGIGAEFRSVVADIRAGSSVVEGLESLEARVPVGAVSRFVDALCTGIERGSPLAEVLSAQADDGREARRRSLMELGGKREILMLLPVVFFIMPVVVVVALLPGLVSLDLLVP